MKIKYKKSLFYILMIIFLIGMIIGFTGTISINDSIHQNKINNNMN